MTAVPPDAAGQAEPESVVDPPSPAERAPQTGVPAADEAAARLDDIDDAPVDQHVEIYEDAHRRLQEGLADLDDR